MSSTGAESSKRLGVSLPSTSPAGTSETASRAVRWAQDHETVLRHTKPKMPATLNGRRADNWRHIFAIADIAGGGWAEKSRAAAATLSTVDSEKVIPVMLLEDIATIFNELGDERISSEELVEQLHALETRPWAEFGKSGNPISKQKVAALLKGFGIAPKSMKFGSRSLGGYTLGVFLDTFSRYLPPVESRPRDFPQNSAKNDESGSRLASAEVATLKPNNRQDSAESREVATCEGGAPNNPPNSLVIDDEDIDFTEIENDAEAHKIDQDQDLDDLFYIPTHLDRRRDRFEPQDEIEVAERAAIMNELGSEDDGPTSKAAWDD